MEGMAVQGGGADTGGARRGVAGKQSNGFQQKRRNKVVDNKAQGST